MDFKDSIKQLSQRIAKLKDSLRTEEATKNALIMPFITALGYDVFDPTEVVPEMDCDISKKKGEKIDYAIMKDGEPAMLIECKHWAQDLALHETQLQRYFVASKAKFGILTNGIRYMFYTDISAPNIMDDKPFLDVNLEDIKDFQIEDLKKFHKSYFDVDNIMGAASELKYMGELKQLVAKEFLSPTFDLVKYLSKPLCKSAFTQRMFEQFAPLVKRAMNSYVNELISDRLKAAMDGGGDPEPPAAQDDAPQGGEAGEAAGGGCGIVTTDEEMEAYYTIKAMLHERLPDARVTYRDRVTYFAVTLDDNIYKTICRLQLGGAMRIAFPPGGGGFKGRADWRRMESLDDLYGFADELVAAAKMHLGHAD